MKCMHRMADRKVRQRLRYLYLIVLLLLWIATLGSNVKVKEGNEYTDFDHVALYILEYNDVPENYITAYMLLTPYRYGVFQNNEEKLPVGEEYTEVYINATINDMGSERFVFSDEALYYTNNHYDSFSEITKEKILAGYYLFRGVLYTFLLLGVLCIGLLLVLSKEVKVNDLKNDIILDYNLLKKNFFLLRSKMKEIHIKRKQK